jgi:NitT/TauT family transport system permease protein
VTFASERSFKTAVILTRLAILLSIFGIVQWLTTQGTIDPIVIPPPTDILSHLWTVLGTSQFRHDLGHTMSELGLSALFGIAGGLLLGAVLASIPFLADVLSPFLAAVYATPFVVFYPIMLVLLGLNSSPVILIAAVVAIVPVSLNTMVALREISPVYRKLGRSLNCSRLQLYRKVLLPAAVPLVVPGIQLGIMVALAAVIAMEFLVASAGIGFRISYAYQAFNGLEVWTGIIIVVVVASILVFGLQWIGARIRQDMV